jgi:aspartyl-tRNA(Asn)/glutamyl-tRNA(Gln) amidotransferase subunit A
MPAYAGCAPGTATAVIDLPFLAIDEAAQLLRTRRLSPVELTRAVLERIELIEPWLHSYITVTAEWALERAGRAEREIAAGLYRGPLHGIPLGLKDVVKTAGVRTTAGSRVLESCIPEAHATVTARLLAAGAVIVGKHTMPEFAFGVSRTNPYFGTPRNPWKADHQAGGSSGGTAAAVAAGLCLGGLGSDTAGSVRIPASYCGICGLKPTYGRVSLRGVIPLAWSLDHLGPMARSARDCALLLNAVAGYDSADPASCAVPADDYTAGLEEGLDGLRVGVLQEFLDEPQVEPQVRAAVERAFDVLRERGAWLVPVRLPQLAHIRQTWGRIFNAEVVASHLRWLETSAGDFSPELRQYLTAAAQEPAPDLAAAYHVRSLAARSTDALMQDCEVLVGPTTAHVAPAVAGASPPLPAAHFTVPFNVIGLPALSVPCGFTRDGLPIGLTIAGRRWDERTVLRVGHAYQQATDWHRWPPPRQGV